MEKRQRFTLLQGFFFLIIISCVIILGQRIYSMNQKLIEHKKTETVEEQAVLGEVSLRTGIEFHEWSSLREYVYCQLLHEGMPRLEVETALSTIGEIQPFQNIWSDETVTFQNDDLYGYLSPILLEFDSGGSFGNLISWRRSYEHFVPIPLASCEKKEAEK